MKLSSCKPVALSANSPFEIDVAEYPEVIDTNSYEIEDFSEEEFEFVDEEMLDFTSEFEGED